MLSADQSRALRCLAEIMIPASDEYGVPAAADEAIFADIQKSLGRDEAHAIAVLQMLETLSDGPFAELPPHRRQAVAAELRAKGGAELNALTRIVVQCYYRDDRVMRSLGMEPRPPYPKGFEVEQGDWSLLDPVRVRPQLYRETC